MTMETVVVEDITVEVVEVSQTETVLQDVVTTETVEIAIAGPQGAQGPTGAQGPAGVSGGTYTHEQTTPSATWTITHNLGYKPGGIVVVDSSNRIVEGDITYASANQVVLTFSAAFSGVAYLS